MNAHQPTIGIAIIVFHVDGSTLQKQLDRLGKDVCVAIADNTPGERLQLQPSPNVTYIPLGKNTGIAHAQNVCIHQLIDTFHCSHIVFFDQDSEFKADYIQTIVSEYQKLEQSHPNLCLLGPKVIDKTNGEEYRSVIHKDSESHGTFAPRREIISSGSCISAQKLQDIGLMDDKLFIDYVDFELCWRAQERGYLNGITSTVTLPHKVGNRELKLPHGYKVIISAPFRYYYQYRNYLWLLRRHYVPMQWKIAKGIKLGVRLFYFPFCVKGWKEIESFMWKGIKDGIFK